jgi:hypothetical protein
VLSSSCATARLSNAVLLMEKIPPRSKKTSGLTRVISVKIAASVVLRSAIINAMRSCNRDGARRDDSKRAAMFSRRVVNLNVAVCLPMALPGIGNARLPDTGGATAPDGPDATGPGSDRSKRLIAAANYAGVMGISGNGFVLE